MAGKAYVCHQTGPEVKAAREKLQKFHIANKDAKDKRKLPLPEGVESPFRHRPIAESLRIFKEMAQGRWDEGSAALRMKQDLYR